MMDIGNLFCIKKTFQFFKNNSLYMLTYPALLLISYLPIYFIINYHSVLIEIVCRTPFVEILLYAFISLEVLAFIPFLSLIFLIMTSVAKYVFSYINRDIYEFNFSNFNIFQNFKRNLNISIVLSFLIFVFIFFLAGLQFLIYIFLYLSYYMLAGENFSRLYDIFIFLLALSFTVLTFILIFFLILPILRKILLNRKVYKLLLVLKSLFSLKFIKISFTYDYFVFWFKWIFTVIWFALIGLFFEILVLNLLEVINNDILRFFVSTYINMLLLTILVVYTSICSIFSKEKLEFPALIDEEED